MNRSPNGRRAFGKAIQALCERDRRQPRQERMAASADVDRTHCTSIEQGLANPTFELLWAVVSAFEIGWEAFGRELDRYPVLPQRPITRSQMPAGRKRKTRSES